MTIPSNAMCKELFPAWNLEDKVQFSSPKLRSLYKIQQTNATKGYAHLYIYTLHIYTIMKHLKKKNKFATFCFTQPVGALFDSSATSERNKMG